MLNTFSVLVLTAAFLTWLWLIRQYSYWRKRGITTLPYSLIWGNMKNTFFQKTSFAEGVLHYYRSFKSLGSKHGGLYLMWKPLYVAMDLDVVKSILQTDFQHFMDRGIYHDEKNDPFSAHLFSLCGKRWKLLRNKLTPTFTSGKIKMMYETMVDCTVGLHKVMDKELGHAVDIKDIMSRFTTDIIGSCAFGLNCDSLENPGSEFRVKGKRMFNRTFRENLNIFTLFAMPSLAKIFKIKLVPPDVTDFFMGVVRDTVAYREKNNIFRRDFLHLLIQLKNRGKLVDDEKVIVENITEDENRITLTEIAAQAFIFFEAGFETSATTMTFCLYELAYNVNIQDKVREEIKRVLRKHDDVLTYEAAMDMHYLEKTINETLRKYPPIASLSRICTKEYKVPGTDLVLEKGVRVMIPVFGIHHDPDFYPNPEKFNPGRFSEENKKKRPAFTFLPFGEGPRACIGSRFAMIEIKVGLMALLLNYEFRVNRRTHHPLKYDPKSFTMSTAGGMWLNFEKLTWETVKFLPDE